MRPGDGWKACHTTLEQHEPFTKIDVVLSQITGTTEMLNPDPSSQSKTSGPANYGIFNWLGHACKIGEASNESFGYTY